MTVRSYPWDSGPGSQVSESDWLLMSRRWGGTGVSAGDLSELQVYADATGRQVKVRSGTAFVHGVFALNDADFVLTGFATNPTINPRIDLVFLQFDWSNNTALFGVSPGDASPTPACPLPTQTPGVVYQLPLAEVLIPPSYTTIAATAVTDRRSYAGAPTGAVGFVNPLVNPGFELWQRGIAGFTTHLGYTADGWQLVKVAGDAATVGQDTGTRQYNSRYSAAVAYTAGGTGGSMLRQNLLVSDGYSYLLGRQVSFSIDMNIGAAGGNAGQAFIEVDGLGTVYSPMHTANQGFETLTINNVTIPTNATYVRVGAIFRTTRNFYLDNAVLTVGPQVRPFVANNPADELARCRRYGEMLRPELIAYANAAGANAGFSYPMVPKAISPTFTVYGAMSITNGASIVPLIRAGAPYEAVTIYVAATAAGIVQFWPSTTASGVFADANP
ncbi:MAG TPA: hypothetical protein VN524_10675 [Hyphomicrobiaceae bacterium]|nr:hypothetical protein [Hyphomicrobiaceae bacterium]